MQLGVNEKITASKVGIQKQIKWGSKEQKGKYRSSRIERKRKREIERERE